MNEIKRTNINRDGEHRQSSPIKEDEESEINLEREVHICPRNAALDISIIISIVNIARIAARDVGYGGARPPSGGEFRERRLHSEVGAARYGVNYPTVISDVEFEQGRTRAGFAHGTDDLLVALHTWLLRCWSELVSRCRSR